MQNLITKQYNNYQVSFDLSGSMVNATEMAKACGKLITDFMRLDSTKEYMEALSSDMGIPITDLYVVKQGGNIQGTWVHKRLALRIAQWCSPHFAVQVDSWIEELFTKGIVEIKPKDPLLQLSEALIVAKQIIEEKDKYIAELEPLAKIANQIINSDNKFRMDEVCGLLKLTIGRNKFFALLRADGILKGDNSPKREHIDNGNFVSILKQTPVGMKSVTLVTGKGLEYLSKKYDHIRLKAV